MPEVLTPLPPDALEGIWLDVLEGKARTEVARAGPGQRLRIDGIARPLLERLAVQLCGDSTFAAETYFVDALAGPEPWRVGVHTVVRRRDDAPGTVLALVPPDIRLSAGDSIDVSTFRAVATDALANDVAGALLQRISPAIVPPVKAVLDDLQARGRPPTMSARLAFLVTIALQPCHELWTVGASLYTLGLVPDFELFARPAELHYSIGQRNLRWATDPLRDTSRTPLERVMRLPLTDEHFRSRLLELFRSIAPERVDEWGLLVATDPAWRSLGLENWPFEAASPPGQVTIELETLRLPARDDGVLVYDPKERLRVAWRTTPPAADVVGLSHFRVEVVRSDQVVAWESPLVNVTRALRRTKELRDLDLDPDLYFVRVVALTESGDPFADQPLRDPDQPGGKRTNESEDFIVLDPGDLVDEDIQPVKVTTVASYSEAELLARWAAVSLSRDPELVVASEIAWLVPIDAASETAMATLRFESHRQFTMQLSQRLRRIEIDILTHPGLNGRRTLRLGRHATEAESADSTLPLAFRLARERLFAVLSAAEVSGGGPVVALTDLCSLSTVIEDYAAEYRRWATADPRAVMLDVVTATIPEVGAFALVAPTHPIRLLWLLQEQELERAWTIAAAGRTSTAGDLVGTWRRALSPSGIPPVIVASPTEYYVEAGPLPGGWASYVSPRVPDSRSAIGILRTRLGAGPSHSSEADIVPAVLADRLETFVQQHAYTPSLVLNVINPGDGALVVEALAQLETRLGSASGLRYEVRLFAQADDPSSVGQAFRDLMEPERQLSEAAARLAGPGLSFLFPKLRWSRKSLSEFIAHPEDFGAHITLVLDHFQAKMAVAAEDPEDRTSFVHGLVQDSPRRFVGRGTNFRWIRRSAPRACPDLPSAERRTDLLAGVLTAIARAQATVLTAGPSDGYVAVSELDLDPSSQSLLYSVHAVSTWVLTLDANLGLDYFDGRGRLDRPGYLLDFTPEFSPKAGRQLLLTTRADEELSRLVAPLLDQLNLDPAGPGPQLIVESLRALSGRLALRLASSPSQRQGALGMALAKLFMESYGLLEAAVVIPLDAHPELSRRAAPADSASLRSDLLVVSTDAIRSHLDFLVVEAKCVAGVGLGAELRERIDQQTASSVDGLRDAFQVAERDDRIDRSVQSWKLSTVLTFYLDRAVRYGLVEAGAAAGLRRFFLRLDGGYDLEFRRAGLVFRSDAATTYCDREDPDLPIWVVGRDVIDTIISEGLADLAGYEQPPASEPGRGPETTRPPRRSLTTHPTWRDVRADLSHGAGIVTIPLASEHQAPVRRAAEPVTSALQSSDEANLERSAADEPPRETGADVSPEPAGEVAEWQDLPVEPERTPQEETDTGPAVDVLIGEGHLTPQYGLLGVVASEPYRRVGVDLNGCNTISVFGVQGGGKSYTLGSILEMSVLPIPGVNRLPGRLGAVVFHYHQTQDYPPEFVSMVSPNTVEADVAGLTAYGAVPAGIEELVVLTTADTVERRMAEFPGVQVEPIKFSSSELTVADWRFLMGAIGNDSLYLKLLNAVMQKERDNLTLDRIRHGLAGAQMSDAQRGLANTRLGFAARFVDDSRSLRSLLQPGRVVVVDLRDEFIEREEALGLFVTMLNVFSGAGMGAESFNKMIVFDEAHKYMGGALIGQVVEVIREMRHKGVSVVIASQDPVNVPAAIVELSSAVILHRFNSPNWLKHIQRSLAALGDLTPAMLSSLATGEAFVWANKATDPVFTRRAVKVRMRPRVTRHGGSTRKAVN